MSAYVKPLGNALRLEIEGDPAPGALLNLVRNPNGDLGGWGWVTPYAGTTLTGALGADTLRHLYYRAPAGTPTGFYTEPLPVAPNQYVAASWRNSGAPESLPGTYTVSFEWLDVDGNVLAGMTDITTRDMTIPATYTYGPMQPPAPAAAATRVRLVFNVSTGTQFALREVTVAAANTADQLALYRANICANPSFEINLNGWGGTGITQLARVTPPAGAVGDYALRLTAGATFASTGVAALYDPSNIGVTGGRDYHFSALVRAASAATAGSPVSLAIGWYSDEGGGSGGGAGHLLSVTTVPQPFVLSDTAWQRAELIGTAPSLAVTAELRVIFAATAQGQQFLVDAVLAERAASLTDYFDGDTPDTPGATYEWAAGAGASASLATYTVPHYIVPVPWVNVLGPTHDITVTREQFNLSTLSAVIVDATLDPSQSELIRPGRLVRLMAYGEPPPIDDMRFPAEWQPLFTGRVSGATVEYPLTEQNPVKRARITLNAVDNVQALANTTSTQGVKTIDELPFVLEQVTPSVPWNCNGSGGQVGAVVIVSTTIGTTAMDQLALTRDSQLGYVWVDRAGVVQAWDRDQISSTSARPPLDEDVYYDVQVGYDTDVLINEVSVTSTTYDPELDEDTTTTYGPYRDNGSIDTWGVHRTDFTVHGLVEADIGPYASEILGANATPVVRLNLMRLRVDVTDDWSTVRSPYAFVELYDPVMITCERAGMDAEPARVASITHTISGPDSKWLVDLTFGGIATVSTPSSGGAGGGGGVVVGGGSGGGGTPVGPAGGDLAGLYPNPDIAANAVTNAKLAANAVTPDKLADSAVTSPKIADSAVTSAKIADGTISDADVAAGNKDGAVATPSLRTLGTGAQQAAAGTHTHAAAPATPTGPAGGSLAGTYPNPTLAPNSVGASQITDGSVGLAELGPGSVNSSKIVDASITGLDIGDSEIATSHIANGAVNGAKLADNAVTTDKILDDTIIPADLSPALRAQIFAAPVSLIANGSFEILTPGAVPPKPENWNGFWKAGAASGIFADDTQYTLGLRSCRLHVDAANGDNVVCQSDVFPVTGGGTLVIEFDARADVAGVSTLLVDLQTSVDATNGAPNFFATGTYVTGAEQVLPGTSWVHYTRAYAVPTGHTLARFAPRAGHSGADAVARDVWLDNLTGRMDATATPRPSWPKLDCRLVATSNITLSGGIGSTLDGFSIIENDRILCVAQTLARDNGIWVAKSGAWVRAPDADTAYELGAAMVGVQLGLANGGTRWGTSWKSSDVLNGTDMSWKLTQPADTGWVSMTSPNLLGSLWTAYANGYILPAYRKQGDTVRMRGQLLRSSGAQAYAFIMPVGLRPVGYGQFPTFQWNGSAVVANFFTQDPATGQFVPNLAVNAATYNLDQIAYDVV